MTKSDDTGFVGFRDSFDFTWKSQNKETLKSTFYRVSSCRFFTIEAQSGGIDRVNKNDEFACVWANSAGDDVFGIEEGSRGFFVLRHGRLGAESVGISVVAVNVRRGTTESNARARQIHWRHECLLQITTSTPRTKRRETHPDVQKASRRPPLRISQVPTAHIYGIPKISLAGSPGAALTMRARQ